MRLQMSTSTAEAPQLLHTASPTRPSASTNLRERLQSIGVKTGEVERKLVEDEIHTTGNVVVDETNWLTCKLRFSGFIEKVFVDATYQYIRKGQPYSQSTARPCGYRTEYLVAKQNQQQDVAEYGSGVASSASVAAQRGKRAAETWGFQQEIDRLESLGRCSKNSNSTLRFPVTSQNAMRCQCFGSTECACSPCDLSSVWVQARSFRRPRTH